MSASAADSSDSRRTAIAVFARWVERQASSEGESFEALLAAHPALATELRALRDDWERVQTLLEELGLARSLGERLRKRYGSQADPGISLSGEGESEKTGDFTSDVFRRLAGRRGEIGRYQLQGEIASGGQGAILRVWDEDLRRHLAMKVLLGQAELGRSGDTPPVDSRTLGRFLEEAQVTGQLDHPGIVPVHELGLDSAGRVYFTMKLVQGRTLKDVFELAEEEREGWTRTRVLSVVLKVCEAMAYAHHKGVVHRDLKPANVMVGRFGEVFVMDWGLAKVLGRAETKDVRLAPLPKTTSLQSERQEADSGPDSPLLTMDGDVVGTPAYMAPEQAQGKVDSIGPHTDVYAVGAMLYHLLARQMPYCAPDVRVSNRTILAMVLQGPPAPLHTLQRDIAAELEAICEQAMARDPAKRYRDTSALAEDLRAFIENRVVRAYETGAIAEARKWIGRNRGFAAASAAAVLAMVAGVVTSLGYASRAAENSAVALREARRADEKAAEAGRLKDEAIVREASATARKDALLAIEELKQFRMVENDLEYARGQDRPTCSWWFEQAHELVDGRPEDPARGLRKKPGLADHRRLLEQVRSESRERTEAEVAADRAVHPKSKELETNRAELQWTSRMLGLEPWPSELDVEAKQEGSTKDAAVSGELAWQLVNPYARVGGRECVALALARAAVEGADEEDRADYQYTLAWALLWAGKIEEALAEVQIAQEQTDPDPGVLGPGGAYLQIGLELMLSKVRPFRDGTAASRRGILMAEVSALEREVAEPRILRFDDSEKEWWNTQVRDLVQGLQKLKERIELVGWSVFSPEGSERWKEAIEAIARSGLYGGLRLKPQLGLLPIGPDPDSGLWEFAHLATGTPAVRGSDGSLAPEPKTGIVFVLLPAGRVPVEDGMQATPLNEVDLDPFFLSKYEMTVAQWLRMWRETTGQHWPGEYAGSFASSFPMNSVSWDDCETALARAGLFLCLPTEAQWEYGCRAGTTTPWWTGAEEETLQGAANIDESGRYLRPVGCLRANPFGLHDVLGNVAEWCRDDVPELLGGGHIRVVRGGDYDHGASLARSGSRLGFGRTLRDLTNGLRVARYLTP